MVDEASPRLIQRLLRIMGGTFGRLLLLLVFIVSLALGAVAHLGLPVSKRAAAQILMGVLSDSVRGTIRVGGFTRLAQGGVGVEGLEILDPEMRPILRVKQIDVDVDVLLILDRVFADTEKLSLVIDRVRIEGCDVLLHTTADKDENGAPLSHLSIADAFEPVKTTKKKKESGSRPIRVWFPRIDLRQVYAKGKISDSQTVEARVKGAAAQLLITDKGASIDIQRFRMKASGIGGVDTSAHGEVHIRAPGPVWGDVDGKVGQVRLSQKFRFEDGHLEVEGELPRLEPSALRPLFGEWPLDRAISVTNKISGTPPNLDVKLTVLTDLQEQAPRRGRDDRSDRSDRSGRSDNPRQDKRRPDDKSRPAGKRSAEITGTIQTDPTLSATLTVVTDELDLNSLLSTLPESEVNSESKLQLKSTPDGVEVDVESRVAEGTVSGQATPSAELVTQVKGGNVSVDGAIRETGLRARVHLDKELEGPTRLGVDIEELLLHENERVRTLLPGTRGLVQGRLNGQLDEDAFQLSSELSVGGFQQGEVSFSHGTVQASASGNLQEPQKAEGSLDVALQSGAIGLVKLKEGTLSAKGPLLSPQVEVNATTEPGLTLRASSFVGVEEQELREFKAEVSGRGKPVEASASRIGFGNSRVRVNELLLRSIGEIRGDFDFGPNGGMIKMEAEGLSISRIGSSLGLPSSEYGGDLNATVDLEVGAESTGTVDIAIANGALYGIDNVKLDAHLTIDRNVTQGNINGSIESLGSVESSWEGTLAGPLMELRSTLNATGQVTSRFRNFDLRGFTVLLGKALGLPPMSGTVSAALVLTRSTANEFPEGEAEFSTKQLVVETGEGEDQLIFRGVDLEGGLSVSPNTNQVEAAVRLNDYRGTLASISGTLELPLQAWGSQLPNTAELNESLKSGPIDAVLVAPRRPLASWPSYFPLPFARGSIGARASIAGTIESPHLGLVIDARSLDGGISPFARPVSIDANTQYAMGSGALRGSISVEHDGQRVGVAQVDGVFPFEYLTEPPTGKVPLWKGRAQVQLDNAPLQMMTALRDREMKGTAQGAIVIDRRGWRPEVSSEVRLRGLEFGGSQLGDALLEANTHQNDLVARAHFTDEYGSLELSAEAGFVPTAEFLQLAEDRPILLTLDADRYDAAVLHPVVSDIFDELNGPLSGRLKAEWSPPTRPGAEGLDGEWSTRLSGALKMVDGTVTPSALGLRLEDTRFNLSAGREGEYNVVSMKNIAARAESTRHNLKGDAKFFFVNLDLQGGMFHLIPTDVPLKSDGGELAVLTGTAQGRFDLTDEETRVEVKINNLTARLPSASDSDLFALEKNPDIQILQHASRKLEKNQEDEEEDEGAPVDIQFELGNNVRLKSDIIDIKVRGNPRMRIADELEVGGAVELTPGGRFLVLGRGFSIEQGTVLFDTGDPTNPHLGVTASWKAPNDVLVRVTVRGTASQPELEWTSEPGLPGGEAEVIALVLGGGGGSTDQGSAGFSSGIAYAANEAIGTTGLTGVEFYATQESTVTEGRMASLNDNTWENYTASFRINDELWFEGSVKSGGGTGPGHDDGLKVSGTLDWRFHPHWSLRTELGELGAGLDLVWRYRY